MLDQTPGSAGKFGVILGIEQQRDIKCVMPSL